MKNIELIDKAIDDLAGEFKPAGNYVVIEESTLAIAHVNANLQPICTRAEFEARKADRQNKPDWSECPAWGRYVAQDSSGNWNWYSRRPFLDDIPNWNTDGKFGFSQHGPVIGDWRDTLEKRPAVTESDWPDEKRIDVVATNGNDGLHYAEKAPEFKHGAGAFNLVDDSPKTAADYLAACAQVQLERGKQYDASCTGERSFDAAAEAFNCVTGKNLRGSDVCLILEMVKLVRQYSDPARLHADSVLDKVSYSALWAEQITAELGK